MSRDQRTRQVEPQIGNVRERTGIATGLLSRDLFEGPSAYLLKSKGDVRVRPVTLQGGPTDKNVNLPCYLGLSRGLETSVP